jgi:hypothetical protein
MTPDHNTDCSTARTIPLASGFPYGIVLELARLAGATAFVETGTFRGDTTRWASAHFQKVYTIERAESLYMEHSSKLRGLGNVDPILGDSREVLRSVLPRLDGQRAVFWLDGHWSGGETAGQGDECPLLGELALLSSRAEDIVLIDDARLFLCAPPCPHDPRQWPTIVEVVAALTDGRHRPYVQIVDDVIIATSDTEMLRECLAGYAQQRAGVLWAARTREQRGAPGRRGLFGLIRRVGSLLGLY